MKAAPRRRCSSASGAIVVNSFSKYYCMTGWRVGWLVLPEELVRPFERLSQSLYISLPELSQRAAIAAFDATAELEAVKAELSAKPRGLLARLPKIGFDELLPVDGAFYVYASVARFTNDCARFRRPHARARRASPQRRARISTISAAIATCAFPSPAPKRISHEGIERLAAWLK